MITTLSFESANLAGNLLDDPSRRDLFVYLPPGYESSDRHYAVAYLLHAFGQTAAELVSPPTHGQRWAPPIEDVLDPVFKRMGVPPMIVVFPEGNSRWGCGQWVDSPVSGRFGSYVAHDVVEVVDANFRTIPSPSGRGILGFSSGGMGAWNIASLHPDVFSAMAVLSGDTYLDMTHRSICYKYFDNIWPDPPSGPVDGDDLSSLTYAYAAAYSPNPANPPHFVDLPVKWPSGELDEAVWGRWLAFDPVVNCNDRLDNLRMLSGILLDVGVNDEYLLQWGHRLLSDRLAHAGVSHDVTENTGNHGGRSRERQQLAISWLSRTLHHEETRPAS